MKNKALELLLANSITIDEYNPQVNKIKEEKLSIEEKISQLNKFCDDFQDQAVSVFELANKSYELFKSSEVDDKRKIINLLFPNLQMDGRKLAFTLQKPFDKWIEFKDRPLWLLGQGSNLRPID